MQKECLPVGGTFSQLEKLEKVYGVPQAAAVQLMKSGMHRCELEEKDGNSSYS
jgi:hypothetical protein